MLRESAKMSSWLLHTKDNIDRFTEKLVLVINKSIEASILLQKIVTQPKSRFNSKCKAAQMRAHQL